MNILVVEDDARVADALRTALGMRGHDVVVANTGAEALEQLDACEFVLLDLGLPDLDGVEVCKRIRARSAVPVIALTARAEEIDRVMGLHAGADDYVVKPYSVHELNARIEAVARRSCRCGLDGRGHDPTCHGGAREVLAVGRLEFDLRSRTARLDGRSLQLTRKEFDLLVMLAEDPDSVHTREAIISRVWDENWYGSTRTLDVHIGSLRTKLGGYEWIETLRGVGFRLGVPARP
ncbi:response regulator transcription factor [Streptomyces longwoodensis]|uniref:response regulator transcription factor n=1 Tax=Streptomyces longwoodensis TaxID=68231 RepID=UPI0033C7DCD2